jgi:hypothetical protein
MRRRFLRIALVVLLVAIAVPFGQYARYRWFPPHYDVPSIALTHDYADPALLAEAWAMPVAKTYAHHVDFQTNGSICGPTSVANAFRSLGESPNTATGVVDGTGKCPGGICWKGLSLDEVAALVREKSHHQVTVLRGLTLAEFREHMKHANDSARRYLVNFHRGLLFGKGGGHHSPIAAYLPEKDLVFVLDVNEKFGPWLVSTERLFQSVDSADTSTGLKRGLLLVQ